MRTLIDIGEVELKALDQIARKRKVSRASLVREALAAYVIAEAEPEDDSAFGICAERKIDGLDYQQRLRAEW
jgi:metal-responsive CopG/Arc/MetJ family transcriptional regulator